MQEFYLRLNCEFQRTQWKTTGRWKIMKKEVNMGRYEHQEDQSLGNERCLENQVRIRGGKINSGGFKTHDGVKYKQRRGI